MCIATRSGFVGLALSLLVAACGDAGAPATPAVTRDSAGVRIVESRAPAWGDGGGWTLTAEPLTRIGAVEGEDHDMLFRVIGATRLSDGRIAVANGGTYEIRYYDAAGRWLASAGRQGEGPGEFQAIYWAGPAGDDSVAAFDARLQRVSLFDPDGRYARSFRLGESDVEGYYWPVMLGRLTTGEFVVAGTPVAFTGGDSEGVPVDSVRYLLFDDDGRFLRRIVTVRATDRWVRSEPGSVTMMDMPFARTTHAAAAGDALFVGTSDRYEVAAFGPDGGLRTLTRREWEAAPVAAGDVDDYWTRTLDGYADYPERQKAIRDLMDHVPAGTTWPAFASFFVDDVGCLWVRDFELPNPTGPSTWQVFDPDGALLGPVALPHGLEPREIGRDFVLGTRTDDLGVEYVEMYGLEREPAPVAQRPAGTVTTTVAASSPTVPSYHTSRTATVCSPGESVSVARDSNATPAGRPSTDTWYPATE